MSPSSSEQNSDQADRKVASYWNYWGKADPGYPLEPKWHPLVGHALDVAAVGVEYLRRVPAVSAFFAERLGGDEGLLPWFAFWFALHDLGKFAEAFQGQREDLFSGHRGRSHTKAYVVRHDTLGWLFWNEQLRRRAEVGEWFGPETADYRDGLDAWVRAVTGHHGQPPETGGYWESHFHRREDRDAIFAFVDELRALLVDDAVAAIPGRLDSESFELASREVSWWVAGIAVLADWVGSNSTYFPYQHPEISLEAYWGAAQARARHALQATGVLPTRSQERSFGELFPKISEPSPLQVWASNVELSSAPQIHLLEDLTGAGKTEAAVVLAHRIMAQGAADGFFIGLPTMATANAMYARIAEVYHQLFAGDPSLVLAHGNKHLVEAFAASVVPDSVAERDVNQHDETATARCAAWLADHNKRALLAPAGVGTIDQVLLGVLQSRHQSLRLLGLFHKVLVVDEVHACDPYMLRVLAVLLGFHARAGGSAILLSATLPHAMKQTLLTAFARGCGQRAVPDLKLDAYPLTTSWSALRPEGVDENPVATRGAVRREVAVRYFSVQDEVIESIEAALDNGHCVCWIRNTVADALDAYEQFRDRLPAERVTLFHARFALVDRLAIEGDVVARFGPTGGAAERAGRLLIATQVVEQSLDQDFDYLVSDLAPIDRIIQRAGRLRRHRRDSAGNPLPGTEGSDGRGNPELWVYGPGRQKDPPEDWVRSALPGTAVIYPNHAQLWLSAEALRAGGFALPDDARSLVEGVFAADRTIPERLQQSADRAQADQYAQASIAQANAVVLGNGYSREEADWWDEARTPSRLGEATLSVVLARWENETLVPWAQHEERRHAWAYSTVKVAERLISRAADEASVERQETVQKVTETLPGKGRWSVLLPLESVDGVWVAMAWTAPGDRRKERQLQWLYDPIKGLQQAISETIQEVP